MMAVEEEEENNFDNNDNDDNINSDDNDSLVQSLAELLRRCGFRGESIPSDSFVSFFERGTVPNGSYRD